MEFKALGLGRVYEETRLRILWLLLLLIAEGTNMSRLLIFSIRNLVWFCCASNDSSSVHTVGWAHDSRELNEWWNDSRALVVLVEPLSALSSTLHMWWENIGGSRLPVPPTSWPIHVNSTGLQIRVQHWGGWSAHFGDIFDIGGMILRFLFLMTFFFARQAFFSPFVKIQ